MYLSLSLCCHDDLFWCLVELSLNYKQERFQSSTPLQISDNKKLPAQPRPQSPALHFVVDLRGGKQGSPGLDG